MVTRSDVKCPSHLLCALAPKKNYKPSPLNVAHRIRIGHDAFLFSLNTIEMAILFRAQLLLRRARAYPFEGSAIHHILLVHPTRPPDSRQRPRDDIPYCIATGCPSLARCE